MSNLARLPAPDTLPWDVDPQVLEHLARQVGFAFFLLDEHERISYWGESATAMLGFGAAEMIGKHCLRSLPCDGCLTGCAMSEGESVTEASLRLADGSSRMFQRVVFPRREGGRHRGGLEMLVPLPAADVQRQAPEIFTRDEDFAAALEDARHAAEAGLPVYIEGEPGTEKLDAARWLVPHARVRMELCAGLDAACLAAMVESETPCLLVLEQIAELSTSTHRVLYTALQRRCDAAAAGLPPLPVQIVCTCTGVGAATVAPDVVALLSSLRLTIPPLRKRPDDIEPAVRAALARVSRARGREVPHVEPAAWDMLRRHTWPGNIDELRLVALRAWLRSRGPVLRRDDFPDLLTKAPRGVSKRKAADDAEVDRIKRALEEADGQVSLAADALGISRSTLWRQRRKHGI